MSETYRLVSITIIESLQTNGSNYGEFSSEEYILPDHMAKTSRTIQTNYNSNRNGKLVANV